MNLAIKTAVAVMALGTSLGAMSAEPTNIYSGGPTGNYFNDICPALQAAVMKDQFKSVCVNTGGTVDNIEKVIADQRGLGMGEAAVVFTQPQSVLDQLHVFRAELGHECIYAVTKDSNITDITDISKRAPIALPSAKSGSNYIFEQLQKIDGSLASARNVDNFADSTQAVAAVLGGEYSVAMYSQVPDSSKQAFEDAKRNGAWYLGIISREILRLEANGEKLYEAKSVQVEYQRKRDIVMNKITGKNPATIETACTPIVFFTGTASGLSGRDLEDQVDLVAAAEKAEPLATDGWDTILANYGALKGEAAARWTSVVGK